MTDKQRRLTDALDQLVAQPGLVGAVLVSRDGLCMINRESRLAAPETFSAMAAALAGAADAAFAELGVAGAVRAVLETREGRMVAVPAGDDFLLVAMAEAGRADALQLAEKAAETVAKLLEG